MSAVLIDPVTGIPYIDFDGHPRKLASIPSNGKLKAMLDNVRKAVPILPRSQWYKLDRRATFGSTDWIEDQNGYGACVGEGSTGALRRARGLAGQTDVKLSGYFTYSLINGGSDNGAVVSDAIDALSNTGTCSFATAGGQSAPIYANKYGAAAKQEAQRFRIAEAYHCASWDELVSAILGNGLFVPFYGMQVGNHFENFDANGVAGHDRGPGNHCMHADGFDPSIGSSGAIDNVNSWSFKWGPFSNGRCFLDEQHLFGGGNQPDVCVIRCAVSDPNDPHKPPIAQ